MNTEPEISTAVEQGEAEVAAATAEQPKKKSRARRILKWVLWSLAGLLAFVLLAVLTLPIWINPAATSLASVLVPKYTGTAFDVERVNLNPYTGRLFISGVKLANPGGYAEEHAFTLVSLSVDVEVSTLLSDTIHVREITIDSPYASYVFDDAGVNNFDRIVEAVNEKLGPKKEKKKKKEETKVLIDKVTVKNVRVIVGNGVFELESLTLADFGKDTPAQIEISGVRLVNPDGFGSQAENAFSLGSLSVGMETADLGKLPIRIHDVVFDSPYASYVFDEEGVDNFTRMLEPLLAKGPAAEAKSAGGGAAKKKEKKQSDAAGAPVTLERLEVRNLKAQICRGRFELASLVVTDFGTTNSLIRLDDVKLVNPEEIPEPNAFSLKSLSVGIETADLSKKPMVFHDIIVDSPHVGVFFDKKWDSNFKIMLKPLIGGEKKEEKKGEVAADEKKDEEKKDEERKDGGARVVIDKLEIIGAELQVITPLPLLEGTLPIPCPTLTDIGKDSELGASLKEFGAQMVEKLGGLGKLMAKIWKNDGEYLGILKELFSSGTVKKVAGGIADTFSGVASGIVDRVKGEGKKEQSGDEKKDDEKKDEEKKDEDAPGLLEKAKSLIPLGK